jgi:hypothetical protein
MLLALTTFLRNPVEQTGGKDLFKVPSKAGKAAELAPTVPGDPRNMQAV